MNCTFQLNSKLLNMLGFIFFVVCLLLNTLKIRQENMQKIDIIICPKKINIKIYLKKKKIKKENMEKIGIIICLKKKRKN